MKLVKLSLVGLLALLSINFCISQTRWALKIVQGGKFLDVKSFDESGKMYDVYAVELAKDQHFMKVMVDFEGQELAAVMLVSNDFYVPVKAITPTGKILDIKGLNPDMSKLDIKGVSRAGNVIRMKALTPNENFLDIRAISPEGLFRDVMGVKFESENIEAVIYGHNVLANVSALPQVRNKSDAIQWDIAAIHPDGNSYPVYAIDEDKGVEHPVRALSDGGNFHLLDVKAFINRYKYPVKLAQEIGLKNTTLVSIYERGKVYQVMAKVGDSQYIPIRGLQLEGNMIAVKGEGSDGTIYAVKAISPGNDLFDVKGIKIKNDDVEGMITGLGYAFKFYAHVKAIPSIK